MTAQYQFIPWVRQGAARAFKNPDLLGPELSRSDGKPLGLLPVGLKINNQPGLEVGVRVYGPGDVTGIDPRVIIRVDPPRRSADFEPNYLASIEFDPPDFPWLFTPAAAGEKGRLRPWLVLVVVEAGDNAHLDRNPGQPLPVLTAALSELPDLVESWAWAHAQVIQPDAGQPVSQVLTSLPNQNLSRLICPRRLNPTPTTWPAWCRPPRPGARPGWARRPPRKIWTAWRPPGTPSKWRCACRRTIIGNFLPA